MVALTPTQLLILQPTPFCNLNCFYCYLPHRSDRSVMQDRTLAAVGRAIVASPSFDSRTTLVWHAGEPCVLPADWYQAATEKIEAAAGRSLGIQSFQTNATLIDDDWVEYFRQPNVRVGVSLDGPAEIHDSRRQMRSGRGTHAAAMRGITRLRAAGVPFHVIAVISQQSLAAPEQVAEALVETGAASIGLNVEEIDGINRESSLFGAATSASYRAFLGRFLDALQHYDPRPRVREVMRFHDILVNGTDEWRAHHQENVPGAIVSVGVGGEVSTFSPELMSTTARDRSRHCFGDVHTMTDISEMFFNADFRRAYREIRAGVSLCRRNCIYFGICGGGAPANKLGEHGRFDVAETMHCRLTVQATVETLLARATTTAGMHP